MGHCPDWSRGSMKKSSGGSNSPRQSSDFASFNRKPDMSHYMDGGMAKKNYRDGGKVMGYADGGIVEGKSIDDYTEEELKSIGLKSSKSDEKGGMFDRLTEGNIDQSGSKAYDKYGAGRGRMEVLKRMADVERGGYGDGGKSLDDAEPMKSTSTRPGPETGVSTSPKLPYKPKVKKVEASGGKKTQVKKIPVSAPTDMDALYEESANAERSGYEAAERAARKADRDKTISDLLGMPTKEKVDLSRVTKSSGGEMGEVKSSNKVVTPKSNDPSELRRAARQTSLNDLVARYRKAKTRAEKAAIVSEARARGVAFGDGDLDPTLKVE